MVGSRKHTVVEYGGEMEWFEEAVATNVASLRMAARMTQSDLASALSEEHGLGFRQQTVVKIENGSRAVKFEEAYAIAEVLGVDMMDLVALPGRRHDPEREAIAALVKHSREMVEAAGALEDSTERFLNARRILSHAYDQAEGLPVSETVQSVAASYREADPHHIVGSVEEHWNAKMEALMTKYSAAVPYRKASDGEHPETS